jgi:hypothetical protein
MMSLHSEILEATDHAAAMELFEERGWTDGLPIVPPTEAAVHRFLDYVGLQPTTVLAEIVERGRVITAEKVAINAVMAGCKPEYMPVIVAVMACFGRSGYQINHLASISSPWLMTIVNGPIAKQIGLNSGMYCLGPGTRANCSIARAISLVLANCTAAKIGGVQRGQWGHPGRFTYCIAENEDLGWGPPLHVMQGCSPTTSAVNIKEVYLVLHEVAPIYGRAEEVLSVLAADWPLKGGATSTKRVNFLFIPPTIVEIFQKAGLTKNDVRQYLFDNVRYSVADLKARGAWYRPREEGARSMPAIEAGDHNRFIYPFKQEAEEYFRYMSIGPIEGNSILQNDIIPIVAGGDAGNFMLIMPGVPDWPVVTRPVATRT